jgi:outer membrane protein assembly factor BamB
MIEHMNVSRLISWRFAICVLFALAANAPAEDWPRWRGVRGDGSWNAPRLPDAWPKEGLKQLWKVPVGGGYAGVIVDDGRVYNVDHVNEPEEVERVQCFDAETSKLLWTHTDDVKYGKLDYGNGPRAAPTITDGKIYSLGALGQLNCLDAKTGKRIWSKHYVADFRGRVPTWGFAASPFVYNNLLIVTPGAENNGSILALDRETGETVWSSLSDESTYATPILFQHANVEQLIVWTPSHIRALDPRTGELLWSQEYAVELGVSIATPVIHQETVFVSGYWDGSRAIRLGKTSQESVIAWENRRELRGLMSQPLCREGHCYLLTRSRGLVCFEMATGKILWDDDNKMTPRGRNPQATLVWLNDNDRAIVLNSSGDLLLVRLNPKGYEEQSRTKIIGETWAHPAYAGNKVYARNDTELICVELPTAAQ